MTEMEDITVPVEVDVDTDALARAATANRRLGIDDNPENSAKMVDAVEDTATTVDITVHQPAGRRLPTPALAAIARGKGGTRTKRTADDEDVMSSTSAIDPRGPAAPVVHSATVNDRTWSWTDDDDADVPEDVKALDRASEEANHPTTGIPLSRRR